VEGIWTILEVQLCLSCLRYLANNNTSSLIKVSIVCFLQIQAELQKPLLKQGHIIEKEISGFIDFLKDKGLSNNGIPLYFAAIQNYMKYKPVTSSMTLIKVSSIFLSRLIYIIPV